MKRRGQWEPTVVTEISERVSFDRQESHVVVTYQQDIPQNHEVWEMVKSAFITILIVYTNHSIYQSRPNRQMVFPLKIRDMLTNGRVCCH